MRPAAWRRQSARSGLRHIIIHGTARADSVEHGWMGEHRSS
jgi:hypothetical protein